MSVVVVNGFYDKKKQNKKCINALKIKRDQNRH